MHWYIYTHLEVFAVTDAPSGKPTIHGAATLKGEKIADHAFLGRVISGAVKGMKFDEVLPVTAMPQECERDGYRLKIELTGADRSITLYSDTVMCVDVVESFEIPLKQFPSPNSVPPSPPTRRLGTQDPAAGPPTVREGRGASGNPPPMPPSRRRT